MSGVNRVGGVEPKKGGNATNGVAAPLVIRGKGASKVEQNDNSIKVDSMLQKVEKHGKISLKEFTKMSGLVDGGKQALGKYLLTKGIVPANTISKLMQKDTNFSDSFNTAASSKSVGLKSICAKLTVVCTGGLVLAATNLGKNNFEAKVDKVELKHVRTKEGSTQLISDMKKLTSPSSLRDYVKNNDVSAQQYDAISKHIPFKVQSQMDVSSMTETLKHQDPAKAKTLSKIFFAMQQGQMSIRKEGTTDTQPWPHDMASALSHGGRVCMVLDKSQVDGFLSFIKGDNKNERLILGDNIAAPSSHGIDHSKDKTGKGFSESKLNPLTVPFRKTENFGINLAVGGKSPNHENLWGAKIEDNGSFGHLLIAVDRTKNPAVIMFGVENSQPGKDNQYGGTHSVDCHAGDTSPSGGTKWKNMGTDVERPAALGGMIVDFRGIKAETLKDGFVKTGSKLTPEQLVGKQLPIEVVQPKEEQPQQHQQILKEEMSKRVRGN